MRKLYIIIPIIAVAVIVSVLMNLNDSAMNSMMDPQPPMMGLDGTVDIGLLFPLTGDLASHGEDRKTAALLAVDDFNQYLIDNGRMWQLNGIVEDSQTNPVIALEKITSLNSKNVNVVVGPATSASVRNSLGYIHSNNMILISCCSTAPALALEDNVFRTVPDDNNQGPAISTMVQSSGIQVLVPVWRGDTWGDGLQEATARSFTEAGGVMDEGIRYNPETPEFGPSASLLADRVSNYVDQYGADKVGVLVISFAETLQFMQQASQYDILDDVKWFGSDGSTKETSIIDDPVGLEFATTVEFTTVQFAGASNPISQRISDYLLSELGRTPNVYAYTSYDAVWLAGLAIDAAQSTDTEMIKSNLLSVAADHTGAVGSTMLNNAGDLASTEYTLWTISDGKWITLDS